MTPSVQTPSTEQFEISITTAAGRVSAVVHTPTTFIPITSLVPLLRSLGKQAQQLEETHAAVEGRLCSCTKGCAACCRMLVPLSPPEAFRLMDHVRQWPLEQQQRLAVRLADIKSVLAAHGIWQRLLAVVESEQPPNDDDLAPLNEAYYSLRIPCPFLEDNVCSVYEERPSACRELLVTSPPANCDDIGSGTVEALPIPIRIGTILGLVWGELTGSVPRLIPLPLVAEWVEHHQSERARKWQGTVLLNSALDKVQRYLSQGQ
ncbi:MAG: YkgJ family cysteine cluster protein [Nitrospira sp.]|nr:YkgJ family cysteine cluster protein [Nitrospira sp.]